VQTSGEKLRRGRCKRRTALGVFRS
jgi:hypothetical protein